MLEYYAQVRAAHVGLVAASGLLFTLRGVAVLAGGRWPLTVPVRLLGHTIDTGLLTAGIMLAAMLPSATFANGWLVAKLVLLVARSAGSLSGRERRAHAESVFRVGGEPADD
jgi:uncharacterized membrane protein SirB2